MIIRPYAPMKAKGVIPFYNITIAYYAVLIYSRDENSLTYVSVFLLADNTRCQYSYASYYRKGV